MIKGSKRNMSIKLTPGTENHALRYNQWHIQAVTTTKLPWLEGQNDNTASVRWLGTRGEKGVQGLDSHQNQGSGGHQRHGCSQTAATSRSFFPWL
jgi:hypothetical protein